MNQPITSLPKPLIRLILCGGDGLAAAWGPLEFIHPWNTADGHRPATWSGERELAYGHAGRHSDEEAAWGLSSMQNAAMAWRLPLDHWRARLSLVAAWLLGWETPACYIQPETEDMHLSLMCMSDDPQDPRVISPGWDTAGRYQHDDLYGPTPSLYRPPELPTLPAHLRIHDPAVALVLALYDVPEIRARLATG